MSSRYKQIKIYQAFDFFPNSPIDILKGALYIDTKTNKIVFQLKFVNMQGKKVKAIYINIKGFNELGEKLEDKEYSYLDMKVKKGEEFGADELKELNDNTIRKITVILDKVVFIDNSIWKQNTDNAIKRSQQKKIENKYITVISNELYEKNIKLDTFYYPVQEKHYWICMCGTYNSNESNECYKCSLSKKDVFKYIDRNWLETELEKQKDIEKEIQEQKENEKKKRLKKIKIIIPIIIGILIIIIGAYIIYDKLNPSVKDILEEGDYINYLDGTGVTRECRVLYDFNSQYGIQIVTTEPVDSLTIGDKSSEDLAKQSYNNAIKNLNDKANEYKNTDFSTMARSLGSNPESPNKEGSYYSNIISVPVKSKSYKNSDNNYETDSKQIKKINLSIQEEYWLASRYTNYESNSYLKSASSISFYLRTSEDKELISRMSFDGWTVPFEKTDGIVPVFNIKDNIKIKNGDGTKNNPYIMAE